MVTAIQHGINNENKARRWFAEHTGLQIEKFGFFVSHNNPWLGYSPNGVIFEGETPTALLEIKCPYSGTI